MKQHWQKWALRLDAMSLRERAMVFCGAALALIFLLNILLLEPQFAEQKKFSQQVKQDQGKIAEMQLEIQRKVQAHSLDPDKTGQEKLKQLRQQVEQLRGDLLGMQKNLVAPEKMSLLLEDLLKRNGKLKLVSLKTLPPENLAKSEKKDADAVKKPAASPDAAKDAEPEVGGIYRHGVEIVVQGNYLDMVNYLSALENMKWELYWGKTSMQVVEYPVATLSLTVYTLSLDKSWMNL
ncbi:MAG: MSHA biogenesis protein MshJ [Burkholderiaceae bacterium]|nr:MSHA biogenesis protein MshJ [Burkholderiaceae bacterium]